MATAIFGSQDYLHDRFRHHAPFLRSRMRNSNPNFSEYRRRRPRPVGIQSNPQNFNRRSRSYSRSMVAKCPSRNLVMGEVKILKRGESLTNGDNRVLLENRKPKVKVEGDLDLVLGSTDRLGTDPETVQKQIRFEELNMYAGSAFVASPPPSSLPVPGFIGKNSNGAATSDLRRLLRLDLV